MKSLIYGYGETGKSFERYLNKKKLNFEIFDINHSKYNKNYDLTEFNEILCSPGFPRKIFNEIIKIVKDEVSNIIIFVLLGVPLYFIFYFYQKKKINEDLKINSIQGTA